MKYWQIGNELGDETYQQGVAAFCEAMKKVDPGIKLMAAFPSDGLLQQAGQYLDYVCPHHYGCDNLAAMEADVQRSAAITDTVRSRATDPSGHHRMEHHGRRLGTRPSQAVDARQCPGAAPATTTSCTDIAT